MGNRFTTFAGCAALASSVLVAAGVASADTVTVHAAYAYSYVIDGSAIQGTSSYGSVAIGGNTSATSYTSSQSGLQSTFSHVRDGDAQDYSWAYDAALGYDVYTWASYGSQASSHGHYEFTANEAVAYSIGGSYETTSGPNFYMYQYAQLYDSTLGTVVSTNNYNYAPGAENDLLTLPTTPETTGQGSYTLGTLSGTLEAGHRYQFYFSSGILNNSGEYGGASRVVGVADGGAAANGTMSFELSPAVVPLPAAAWGGIALFGMIGAGKLRRRRRADAV